MEEIEPLSGVVYNVLEDLEYQKSEVERLRSRVAELDELSDNRRHKIKQMAAVLGGLRQENADLRAALVEERARFQYTVQLVDFSDGEYGGPVHWEDMPKWRQDHFRENARAAVGENASQSSPGDEDAAKVAFYESIILDPVEAQRNDEFRLWDDLPEEIRHIWRDRRVVSGG